MQEQSDATVESMFEDSADDSMKFSNGDVCLDEIVEKNGGHYAVSNADIIADDTW